MITVGVIRNGARYLSRHLRKNDYWSEGEAEMQGEWIGEGAKALGLRGAVEPGPFEALRTNCHPHTGARLTPGCAGERVAFFDIQLSAPKDVSVLGMVGGDVRVRDAFVDAAKIALAEMERFAAVRERRGDAHQTEAFRLTRNFVGALLLHDASRDLDPQPHVHAVLANAAAGYSIVGSSQLIRIPSQFRWVESGSHDGASLCPVPANHLVGYKSRRGGLVFASAPFNAWKSSPPTPPCGW